MFEALCDTLVCLNVKCGYELVLVGKLVLVPI